MTRNRGEDCRALLPCGRSGRRKNWSGGLICSLTASCAVTAAARCAGASASAFPGARFSSGGVFSRPCSKARRTEISSEYVARLPFREPSFLPVCVELTHQSVPSSSRSRPLRTQLERLANAAPSNPALELNFLRELNGRYPEAVIARYEAGRFKSDPAVTMEYLRALRTLGRAPPETAAGGALATSGVSSSMAGRPLHAAAEHDISSQLAALSQRQPLSVQIVQGWKQSATSGLWTTARWLGVAFLVCSMAGAILDERGGVSSRMGMNHQIHSAETSDKRFSDVMGVDEAKAELQEIVMYLKNPDRFTRLVRPGAS